MTNIQAQINILVELQGVELEILDAGRRIVALGDEAVALDNALASQEAAMVAARSVLDDLKKTYRELESEAKLNAGMIAKSNEKLRAVKTNKEYQSILKEIEEIRKKKSDIEDRMLEQLEQIESAEAAFGDREAQLSAFTRTCRENKTALAAREQHERQSIEALNQKKAQVNTRAEQKIISIWDDVKKKVRGMAVVPVQQAVCMGCHMNIPAQLFNELQRFDELRFCPHCHRIIYWKEKDSE